MSQNTHTGVSNNRRPVSQANSKERVAHTTKVLEFLAQRAKADESK
ncbi:hypothetical protein J5F27_12720 [Schleiferilactobacillus harbinensis]|uniref:Uncharacterized protein n=1 Tax=Schleiferilactobacillus harbinensis TaxID=304207 RepID=A0ABU7SWS8_9LACO|nr:hypothetical protein [Schleiferilactobacillus harbinensis]MBO3092773.1 hypothetical protein [Schleiferilactobacillus harbinensis]MCI1687932.1 hypothetical protein [Schleiferilactobacillus harbinensis]MCI1783292.1 hypothetical protein [Schleiferilactobacillus harbinensis]MCI1851417.1 hypothetical protein [Schleiferilactobacillus harbinensis]GEK05812.1 hypothetical protein LHA01_10510 [Schleiferilactobacillus harbinensis]